MKDSIKREIDLINIIFNKNIIVDISEDGTIILKSDSEINVPITRNVLFEKKKCKILSTISTIQKNLK